VIRSGHDDGFTLGGLLVSLALLSLMTIYAVSAFSSLKSMNRAVDRAGAQMEVDAVARHLREAIADVRAVFVMDENNAPRFLFAGSNDTLEFVTASNGEREAGGLYLVRYSLDTEGVLQAERRILRDKLAAANKVVLLRGVKDISFSYRTEGDTSKTLDEWDQKDLLPSAIEINVVFEDADFRTWPRSLGLLMTAR